MLQYLSNKKVYISKLLQLSFTLLICNLAIAILFDLLVECPGEKQNSYPSIHREFF